MKLPETTPPQQATHEVTRAPFYERLVEAAMNTIGEALAIANVEDEWEAGDKIIVQQIRDAHGAYMQRIYKPESINSMRPATELSLSETLEAFTSMYALAGINLIPHSLVERQHYPPVMLTDISSDPLPPSMAMLQEREKVLSGLGNMLSASSQYLPSAKTFSSAEPAKPVDPFAVELQTGKIYLTKVDPYLNKGWRKDVKSQAAFDAEAGAYMEKILWLIQEWATDDDERTALATAFYKSADKALGETKMQSQVKTILGRICLVGEGYNPATFLPEGTAL